MYEREVNLNLSRLRVEYMPVDERKDDHRGRSWKIFLVVYHVVEEEESIVLCGQYDGWQGGRQDGSGQGGCW